MEYKVTVTYNDKRRKVLNENSEYGMIPISRGDFWQLLSELDKGKIKSFSVSKLFRELLILDEELCSFKISTKYFLSFFIL